MARLHILSSDDFDSLYAMPKLEEEDRPYVFDLDAQDHEYLATIDVPCKIDYILQLTYFRLSQYFFDFTFQGVRNDVWHIIETYFPQEKFPKKQISKHYKYQNRKAILTKYEMVLYAKAFEANLKRQAKELAKKHVAPKYIFDSLLDYCHQRKTVRPGYSVLQDVISEALESEKARLSNKLYLLMDKELRDGVDHLLEQGDEYYQLTAIKKDQKDFATTEIRKTLKKHQALTNIYQRSLGVIKALGLSEQNVAWFKTMVSN